MKNRVDGSENAETAAEKSQMRPSTRAAPQNGTHTQAREQHRYRAGNDVSDYKLQLGKLNQNILHKTFEIDQLRTELDAVYNSMSWRITAPLRKLLEPFALRKKRLASHRLTRRYEKRQPMNTWVERKPETPPDSQNGSLSTDEILTRVQAELNDTRPA